MKTASMFHPWSEARKRLGIDILEVDPSLASVRRAFAGMDAFVDDFGKEPLAPMDLAIRVASGKPFTLEEACEYPRAFAVFSGASDMVASLRFATTKPPVGAVFFDCGYIYPAHCEHFSRDAACAAIKLEVVEGSQKEIRSSAVILGSNFLLEQPLQFEFRSNRAQPWAKNTYEGALRALKRVSKFEAPIDFKLAPATQRKLVALMLFPEFTVVPPVSLASLKARFGEFSLKVIENNVRDLFGRMQIKRLESRPTR